MWPEILLWLQEDPDANAKALLDRLDKKYPGQFPERQLLRGSSIKLPPQRAATAVYIIPLETAYCNHPRVLVISAGARRNAPLFGSAYGHT